jgi:nitrogen fixation/metabolism regulation signal transduction histidine kinase
MGPHTLRRWTSGAGPFVGLTLVLLVSLKLMGDASESSSTFGRLYPLLVLLNLAGLLILAGLLAANLIALARQLRARVPGSRLTARMVAMFVLIAGTPVLTVFYFSLQFLQRGIDSWFDVRVERALNDAIELSRTALDTRMREIHRQTQNVAAALAELPNALLPARLDEEREVAGATELTVVTPQGRIIASSSADTTTIVPPRPDAALLLQVRQSGAYVGLDPAAAGGLMVRAMVRLPEIASSQEARIVQGLFPVAGRMRELAASVESAFAHYRELVYLRGPLKASFVLTLSLVLLLSLLGALWAAFFSARRLAAPIRDLAEGTRAVAAGDYGTRLPESSRDEMGFLVQSFNEMTRRLSLARDEASRSQQAVEEQRQYLEAVLARLSSGVVTVDDKACLCTANAAAGQILGVELGTESGRTLEAIAGTHPHMAPLAEAFARHLGAEATDWREEVSLFGPNGRQVLMCRGTPLLGLGEHVIVFDDVTALIQAQRDAAWSEVARRLAHEIKNPLTPIQLSAERLRHKYLDRMQDKDREVLDRLTHTIIQQVEAMKEMVNAFSSYARTPQVRIERVGLNELAREVVELYRYNRPGATVEAQLDERVPRVDADPGRLRQVLHNLLKNALEACEGRPGCRVALGTRYVEERGAHHVEVSVEDDGPGFAPEVLEHLFEPYVTTKSRGTGLGLAIVKKIVEEHGGIVRAEARPEGGARVWLRIPAAAEPAVPAREVKEAR